MPTPYEKLAWVLGTKPVEINFAEDAFTFSCGDATIRVTPIVWLEQSDCAAQVVAVGDDPPQSPANPVYLTSAQIDTLPVATRQKALESLLDVGMRQLPSGRRLQRPVIVFRNDNILAHAFENEQREALRQVASAALAVEVRFE